MHVTVSANQLLIAPRKLRAVIYQLRSQSVPTAIAHMKASSRVTTEPIRKLLLASISAAHDRQPALEPKKLVITEIYCNEAARLYRSRRKSKGRATRIAKRGSHLTLTVSWPDRPVTSVAASTQKRATKPTVKTTVRATTDQPKRLVKE
ncbi:50S ribosomal protein L22 [Candidatus Berkelbacteria bacterium]|nr:50S ribosomal protein L22 [Candidatus Berkelbacteria bacterium]